MRCFGKALHVHIAAGSPFDSCCMAQSGIYQHQGALSVRKCTDRLCPIRESDEMYAKYFSSSLRDTAMHELGVGTTRDMDSVITGIFFPSLRCKAYTWQERINIWRGKELSTQFPVVKDSTHFNAFSEVPSLQILVYFLHKKPL